MELLERLSTALGGRYRPERELGRGGMAVVFLAEDLKHHRPVAIKLLNPELSADLGGERFVREIETAAALQHPNIVPLFDSGHTAGLLYYVMPFVAGESLRQRLAREPQFPLDEALRIAREVGSALLEYFGGRYDTADSGLRVVLLRDSTDILSRWGLALVQEQQGDFDAAIANLEAVVGASLNRKASLGHTYAVAGQVSKARAVLAALRAEESRRFVPSYYFALVHAGLGERDAALRELERSYEERSTVLSYLLVDPRLNPLRSDPRFLALARQLRGE